jgi:hypothetical protein
MVWRASLSIAGKQSGLHFIQRAGCGCPFPSGTAAPLVCGQFALSACEPEFEC